MVRGHHSTYIYDNRWLVDAYLCQHWGNEKGTPPHELSVQVPCVAICREPEVGGGVGKFIVIIYQSTYSKKRGLATVDPLVCAK